LRVTQRVYRVPVEKIDGYQTEVWLLDCEGGLILIDVGFTEACFRNIQNELEFLSKTWSDLKLILITHAHSDHIDNIKKVLNAARNPEVMLGELDFETLKSQTGVEADMTLDGGDVIDACGGIEVISAPGHSPGNLCFYIREDKLIIAGDTIMIDEWGTLIPPPSRYCEDPNLAKQSIKKILDYDFDKLLLSHGEPILIEAKKSIEDLVKRLTL
jgi:glyoxylase-like metal-dependent hydrolase (beta-lactamase superfamily II)